MTLRIVTALAGAKVGGAEAFFVALTASLARAGIPVHAVMKANAQREADLAKAGVGVSLAPFGKVLDFRTGAVFRQVAASFQPDIVLAFAGRAASRTPRGSYKTIGRLGGYYNLANFRHCDHLVCNAPDLIRYVTEGGWPKQNVSLIPNFPNLEPATEVRRQDMGTPEGVPLAVALGRLHRNKGLDILIEAAARVPDLWVWIAGEGPERQNLEALTARLGVETRVKFLGWRNDRAGLLKAADFCVYPSREEPFGNVVIEAWGYGTALIAASSTGPAWLIRDGEDAILTPVDDIEATAAAIRRVISSPDLRAYLVANGCKRIEAEFTEENIIRRYIELFESVQH